MQQPGFWMTRQGRVGFSRPRESPAGSLRVSVPPARKGDLAEMAETPNRRGNRGRTRRADESVEARLEELEEARLFSGEYDHGDAIVLVHAGAGGTDLVTAEILLRMYLRWAEWRGFRSRCGKHPKAKKAGLKSATFLLKGENPTV